MKPGEYFLADEDIQANTGRQTVTILVRNSGDRPVQVGSHYNFFEVNRALKFNRANAWGMRLNIPSGTAVRFEPGDEKEVTLIEIGGIRLVRGHRGLTEGLLVDPAVRDEAIKKYEDNV
jgi:urease subunit beta